VTVTDRGYRERTTFCSLFLFLKHIFASGKSAGEQPAIALIQEKLSQRGEPDSHGFRVPRFERLSVGLAAQGIIGLTG